MLVARANGPANHDRQSPDYRGKVNIAAASLARRPWVEASTIPARRNRTQFFAVWRCPWSGVGGAPLELRTGAGTGDNRAAAG